MATQYMLTTNGIDYGSRYTSKARAISEAETIGKAAAERGAGDVITVRTVKTSKVVFSYTATLTPADICPNCGGEESDPTDHGAACKLCGSDGHAACQCATVVESHNVPTGCVGVMQNVEGACAAHMEQVESFPHTMLPNALETAGMVIVTPSVPEAQIVIDAYRDDVSVEEISGMLTGELRHAFFVEDKSIEEIIAMARDMTMLPTPVAPSVPVVDTVMGECVGVRQSTSGTWGIEHIHAAGCWDIARELKRFGQTAEDAFVYGRMTVAEIAEVQDGGRVEGEDGSLEWWTEVLFAFRDENKIMACADLPLGMTPFGPVGKDGQAYVITNGTVALESADGPMSGQYDDYDYAADEIKFAAMENGTAEMCAHGRVVAIQDGQTYVCGDCIAEPEMVDTMGNAYDVEAQLTIDCGNGAYVDLGWHTFTITPDMTELDIPVMYGKLHGEGTPRDGWASIITVEQMYAAA